MLNFVFKEPNLLGYKTHADYILEERMAKTPQTVKGIFSDLLEKARPFAQKEFENLSQFAQKIDGLKTLQKWDNAYYSEQLKKQQFDIDDAQLKPYFKLENVIDGAFQIAEKLLVYNLKKYKISTPTTKMLKHTE